MDEVVLNDQIVQAIMKFMERVELKGKEVPTYLTCMQALENEFNYSPKDDPPEGNQ